MDECAEEEVDEQSEYDRRVVLRPRPFRPSKQTTKGRHGPWIICTLSINNSLTYSPTYGDTGSDDFRSPLSRDLSVGPERQTQ